MDDIRSELIKEGMQLKDRKAKLKKIIEGKKIRNLHHRDQELLRKQLDVMEQYDDILEERLART